MKFTTREGSKAANGSLFRIENVIFVTSLRDTTSKRKDEQERGKKKSQDFESVLKEACAETEKKEISYTASGYTKNGMSFYKLEKRREYV